MSKITKGLPKNKLSRLPRRFANIESGENPYIKTSARTTPSCNRVTWVKLRIQRFAEVLSCSTSAALWLSYQKEGSIFLTTAVTVNLPCNASVVASRTFTDGEDDSLRTK